MNDLTFHLGFKKEEENVRVFIVVVLTEFQSHLMQKFANKEYAVTVHLEQQVNEPLEYTVFVNKHFTYRERAYLKK